MKKIILLMFTLALLLLTACGSDFRTEEGDEPIFDPSGEVTNEQIISKSKNFEISSCREDGMTKYTYVVYADDGTVMETALCAEQPRVAAVTDGVIGIRFTNDTHMFCRFYNYQTKEISKSFRDAFWDNGKLVAYHYYSNGHIMVVRDIFNDNGYYYEIPVECTSWQLTVFDVQEDEDSISVEYYMGASEDSNTGKGKCELPIGEPADAG